MKTRRWVGCLICFVVLGFLTWIVLRAPISSSGSENLVSLQVGDSYELVSGRKIVLLAVERHHNVEMCALQLISCENNSCVELEHFFMSMMDNGVSPPADIFLLGFKIQLIMIQPKDQSVTLEISKIAP